MSCTPEKHISARTKYCPDCGTKLAYPTRVQTGADLFSIAEQLGVRPDWHEPDQQKVTARVLGTSFDNAGFWPREAYDALPISSTEMYVELLQDGRVIAQVNLATLFALACGTIE